jgi:membrane-bound lytic murein transglycosylase D
LRRPVYTGQKYIPKGHNLRLPLVAGKHKKSFLSEIPKHLYKSKQKRSLFYRVQKGDTASKIANVHGIELSELTLANNLNSRATIYAGQNLRLPWPDEKVTRLTIAKVMEKDNKSLPDRSASSKKQSDLEPRTLASHKRDSTAFSEKLQTDNLPINLDVVTGSLSIEKFTIRNKKTIGTIRVMAEETLGHYADWLKIATQEIRKLNGFRYGSVLRINEPVKIPLEINSKEIFEEKRFEYHKKIVEDFFTAYKVGNIEIYKIKDGDTMWKICHEVFEVPLWLIIKYNPSINVSNLRPLHKILVPVVEKNKVYTD